MHFESRQIATRQLFGGNLIHQPAYQSVHKRVVGDLANCNWLMNNSLFVGVYPGYCEAELTYIEEAIHDLTTC